MQNLLKQIKSRTWFEGVRRGDSLLFFSIGLRGQNKYLEKEFGKGYFQNRILFPSYFGHVRIMELSQAKKFMELAKEIVLKNPASLPDFIKEDFVVLNNLIKQTKDFKKSFSKNNFAENKKEFLRIMELIERHGFLFYVCFAFGLQLFKNLELVENKKEAKKIIKEHDVWRNADAAKQEKIENNLKPFLIYLGKNLGLKNKKDILNFEISELLAKLQKKEKNKNLHSKIAKRKNAFMYVALDNKYAVIDDSKMILKVKEFLTQKEQKEKEMSGQIASSGHDFVSGKIRIVRDPKKGKLNKGEILVAVQTTPAFFHLMKNAKAIITEEGGITSHAAIISREMNIPCIVGVKKITRLLKTGDYVEMNMATGKIQKSKSKGQMKSKI